MKKEGDAFVPSRLKTHNFDAVPPVGATLSGHQMMTFTTWSVSLPPLLLQKVLDGDFFSLLANDDN